MSTAETWTVVTGVCALLVTVFAAAIGVLAWLATKKAAATAADMKEIEARRWHADLTPAFDVTCAREWLGDTSGDRALLRIRLVGPPGLDRLTIKVTVRDDWPGRTSVLTGGPTQEEIEAQVWGPYRFIHGVDGGSEDGRTAVPFSLLAGDGRQFALDRTVSPRWAIPADWRRRYDDAPLRLALHCVHGDDKPWIVRYEVPVDRAEPT